MELLPQDVREIVAAAAIAPVTPPQTNGLQEADKSKFITALNEILKRRDFYRAEDFEKVVVTDDAKTLLSRNQAELSDGEVERLNRLLLEVSHPQEIAKLEPYVGPRPYKKGDQYFFFGRDQETDELVSIVTAHSVVLFYAQSGAGKTSLLNAGLSPKLSEEEQFDVLPPMRVQGQIPEGIKVSRKTNIYVFNALMSCCKEIDPSKLGSMTLTEFLKGRPPCTNQYGEPSPRLMIFDQFEELFTSYHGRWEDRQKFFEQLRDALEGDPLLRVVLAMREDYIAEVDPHAFLLPEKLRTRFRLEHLREKATLLAITKPLTGTWRNYAKDVAEELTKNLLKIPSQDSGERPKWGLYVEPVQLQVVCQNLWQALGPDEVVITRKHLEKYGDVSQALSKFYEGSIKSVAQETGVKEEALRTWFGETLITSEGTRAPVYRGKTHTGGLLNSAVDKLEAIQLIKGEWRGVNVRWYELAHDRFIEPIRRSNEKWLAAQSRADQTRLRLENKAAKWRQGNGGLLDADELLEANRLLRSSNAPSESLRLLVDASRASSQRKRMRLYKWGIAILLPLVILLGIMAYYVTRQRTAARKAEGVAKSRLLAKKASDSLVIDPELSVLLAKEAIEQFPRTEEAEEVIRTGLSSLFNVRGALRGHTGRVSSATFNYDGRYILTTSDDGTAKLWDASTKQMVKELRGEQSFIVCSAFSPDGKLIVTGGTLGMVLVWDGSTGEFLRELKGHTDTVSRAAFSPDSKYILTASADHTARVWNASTGESIKPLGGHQAGVHDAAFSPDGLHIATEAQDNTGRIWNLNSNKAITLPGLSGPNAAIAFSSDGKLLATEGGTNTESGVDIDSYFYPVTVWDVGTGKEKFTLKGHQEAITSVAFSPDGKLIVTASADGTARVWDVGMKGALIWDLRSHTKAISRVTFSPDGKLIVTASADNTARVWDVSTGQSVAELRGHSGAVNSAAFSPGGNFIVTASDDKTARIWEISSGLNMVPVLRSSLGSINCAAFSPDGKLIAIAGFDGRAQLWDPSTGKPVVLLDSHPRTIASLAFSPDGKFLVTSSFDNTARLWRLDIDPQITKSNKSVIQALNTLHTDQVLSGHSDYVNRAAFSPDGRFIVTASKDTTARVWDVSTRQTLAELRGHTGKVNSAVFSPDGKLIVTASDDKTVRIWDATSYKFIGTLGTYDREVYSAEYSPNGELIVTASADGIARVWNVKTGKIVAELRGHTDKVNSATFSPNGKLMVTSSDDKTARVWDTSTWQSIAPLRGHTGKVFHAAFSPDGRLVVTASEDRTARIYLPQAFAPFEELRALIPQRVTRELTTEERRYFLDEPQSR